LLQAAGEPKDSKLAVAVSLLEDLPVKHMNLSILKLSFVLFKKQDFKVETSCKMLNAFTCLIVIASQRTGRSFFSDTHFQMFF